MSMHTNEKSIRHRASHLAATSAIALFSIGASVTSAEARTLTIGTATPTTSADPYFQNATPNNVLARHIFEPLVVFDEKQKLAPALAESWTMKDPLTWEFKLRPNLVFSDGTPLTSEDVVASMERAGKANSPGSVQANVKTIKSAEAPDPLTVVLKTSVPDALLPAQLTRVAIISKQFKDAPTNDFNSKKATLGAGAYILTEYVPGDRVVMKRNDKYWGPKQIWDEVVLKATPDDAARTASLLAGDVDLIEGVSPTDVERLKSVDKVKIVSAPSNRMVYLAPNQAVDSLPFITDKTGKPLAKNPFKDLRVRQAVSHAINREAIVERIMDGFAMPTAQWLPTGGYGTAPGLQPEKYDPELAKKLLAEAGFPGGFSITAHSSNNRYINDSKIIQAVAQMLSRVGIDTKAEALPWSTFQPRANAGEFALVLGAWGANTGETSVAMQATVATRDADRGRGHSNYGGYSNVEFDKLFEAAQNELEPEARNIALGKAAGFAIGDEALIPLHHEVSIWATKASISYMPRADQYTLALGATPSGD